MLMLQCTMGDLEGPLRVFVGCLAKLVQANECADLEDPDSVCWAAFQTSQQLTDEPTVTPAAALLAVWGRETSQGSHHGVILPPKKARPTQPTSGTTRLSIPEEES